MKRTITALFVMLIMLAGCVSRRVSEPGSKPFAGPAPSEYIRQVVEDTIPKFAEPQMSEYEKVKAAFDYLIETGYYQWPLGLDVWRMRCGEGEMPSYVENRSLTILLNGIGTCEDYSAALVMLLECIGIEAKYVPGLTYHRDGYLVHHAWVTAKVDGVWYHIDCQLEDGISKGTVNYKYFMKSDSTMIASHRWGQNLIDSGLLEDDQNEEIAREYLTEPCPQDYPTPEAKQIPVTPRPDEDAIWAELQMEYREFAKNYGALEYIELNVQPPVFGRHGGYGKENITSEERPKDLIYNALARRMIIPPNG